MFKLVKFIIWLVGLAVVSYFILRYFGYDINFGYFAEKRSSCQEQIRLCREKLFAEGYQNPDCRIANCVQSATESPNQFIIKKSK